MSTTATMTRPGAAPAGEVLSVERLSKRYGETMAVDPGQDRTVIY